MIIRTCDQFFNLIGLLTSDCETRVLVVLLHIQNVCEELLYVRCCCQASMHKYGATILNLKQPHGRLKFLDPLSFYTPTPPLNHRLNNTWIRNASRDPLNCQLWAADPLK